MIFRKKTMSQKRKLKATIVYNKKLAQRLVRKEYYVERGHYIRNMTIKKQINMKLHTPPKESVTRLFIQAKAELRTRTKGIFDNLKNIYEINRKAASIYSSKKKGDSSFPKTPPVHSNLLFLVSSLPALYVAYRTIRPNKGAQAKGFLLSQDRYNRLTPLQKSFVNKTFDYPDGISNQTFYDTITLLRKGSYPWGASRRVMMSDPKPGRPDRKRPLTIPPFMDRVVQKAIYMLLEAMYEPWFDITNRSFGFRPHKGCHDAIYCVTNDRNIGMIYALEGDIEGAYNKVRKDKLLSILSHRINDRKFLNLIKERLDYQYFDVENNTYVEEEQGIPQGGIDAPYLWNIYMAEFDDFILDHLDSTADTLNDKALKKEKWASSQEDRKTTRTKGKAKIKVGNILPTSYKSFPLTKQITSERGRTRILIRLLDKFPNRHAEIMQELNALIKKKHITRVFVDKKYTPIHGKRGDTNPLKYQLIKESVKMKSRLVKLPASHPNKRLIRFTYCRYADDWIILTNGPRSMLIALKSRIKSWLWENLGASLSEEKTSITDIRSVPAKFLGFEILAAGNRRIGYKKFGINKRKMLSKTTNGRVFALPDRQRIINNLFRKHVCSDTGFPISLNWLSSLEPHIIIERFNAVLRGQMQYYAPFVSFPRSSLHRWIYVITYSCYKTLACKFHTSISKLMKRFHSRSSTNEKTISIGVNLVIEGHTYGKEWSLLTKDQLLDREVLYRRFKVISETFESLEKGISPTYEKTATKGVPSVVDDKYIDQIAWVNLRTQAAFGLACSKCGTDMDLEMHHINKKVKTNNLGRSIFNSNEATWDQRMAFRNRNQSCLCKACHIGDVHAGKYDGKKLPVSSRIVTFDDRLITIETYIKPGNKKYIAKTLEEKGFVKQK